MQLRRTLHESPPGFFAMDRGAFRCATVGGLNAAVAHVVTRLSYTVDSTCKVYTVRDSAWKERIATWLRYFASRSIDEKN
jgi:hypothetical protein